MCAGTSADSRWWAHMAEKRREDRISINRSVEFTVQRYPNNYCDGTAVDYSQGGMKLLTDRNLLTGDKITVYWGQRKLAGSVAYCLRSGSQFSVGVRLAAR